jgi:hypothetical protein
MNSPFAEMSYSSSGLNIVPERLLLATRRPSTHHPLASGAAFFDPLRAICRRATNHLQHTAQHLAAPCKPSAVVLRSTWRPPAQHPPSRCAPSSPLRRIRRLSASHLPASSPRDTRQPIASYPLSHGTASFDPRAPSSGPCRHLPARTDALNGPQNKPSAQAGALNPCKNTFCVIVNCPLQIKPVFYFLFTSIASPTHRIRVKSSLLRLGRSCLALPFTHLGKDIT